MTWLRYLNFTCRKLANEKPESYQDVTKYLQRQDLQLLCFVEQGHLDPVLIEKENSCQA